MNFVGVHISCAANLTELLIAEFSILPFDTFEEHENGFSAYCVETNYSEQSVSEIIIKYKNESATPSFSKEIIPKKNWNEIWESNFDPVIISNDLIIRAPFHKKSASYKYEIVLNPKMAFGTGHHSTTTLMLREISLMNLDDKVVYDIGAGTGVLAILAKLKGAKMVVATDIDDWCIDNCLENFKINKISGNALLGTIAQLNLAPCDVLFANINKNILMEELAFYAEMLGPNGSLLLSGFYESDNPHLIEKAEKYGFIYVDSNKLNTWSTLLFSKPTL